MVEGQEPQQKEGAKVKREKKKGTGENHRLLLLILTEGVPPGISTS